LADNGISIEAMLQREPAEGEEQVDVIFLTHRTLESSMNAAIAKIEALTSIAGPAVRIRMESLAS
jgi:homoserine dehydrogenase